MSAINQENMMELQQKVLELGTALEVSERRAARMERGLRWAGIGAVAALAVSVGVGLRPLGSAVAQATAPQPSQSVEEALDRINQQLAPISQVGQMMGQMMYAGLGAAIMEAQTAVRDPDSKSPLRPYMLEWFQANNIKPDQATPQNYQMAIMAAAGGVMTDAGVLMSRLRKDSDKIHALITALFEQVEDPHQGLQAIGQQLMTLNEALESVPEMSRDVNVMTHQMGVMSTNMSAMTQQMGAMSYSVGSTMGRAGSWMPW